MRDKIDELITAYKREANQPASADRRIAAGVGDSTGRRSTETCAESYRDAVAK